MLKVAELVMMFLQSLQDNVSLFGISGDGTIVTFTVTEPKVITCTCSFLNQNSETNKKLSCLFKNRFGELQEVFLRFLELKFNFELLKCSWNCIIKAN